MGATDKKGPAHVLSEALNPTNVHTHGSNGNGRAATRQLALTVPDQVQLLAAIGAGVHGAGAAVDCFTGLRRDLFTWLSEGLPPAEFRPGDPEAVELVTAVCGRDPSEGAPIAFRLVSPDEFRSRPPVEWLCGSNEDPALPRILPHRCLSMLYGPSGEGKTFTAIDMSLCVHAGIPWHGHPVLRVPVVYVCAEGGPGLGERLDAWEAHYQVPITAEYFQLIEVPIQFYEGGAADTKRLITSLQLQGYEPGLIVVDTLARCTVGAQENGTMDTGIIIRNLDTVVQSTGAAVVVVHHAGKSGDMRGSSNYTASIDTIIEVTKEHKSDLVTVHCRKSKHGKEYDDITLALQESGPSCVLVPSSATFHRHLSEAWRLILEHLEASGDAGASYSEMQGYFTKKDPNDKDRPAIKLGTFKAAMSDLWGRGEDGKPLPEGLYVHNPTKGAYRSKFYITDAGIEALKRSRES